MNVISRDQFEARWSQLHGGAEIKGVVSIWLKISFRIAQFFSRLHLTPNALTFLGLISAIAVALSDKPLFALVLLTASLFFDGVDGSLAIVQSRESTWGSVLDSIADRLSEALWLYAGWRFGIPAWMAISMWALAATQEYARARSASLGFSEVGVVTITERPVRAIYVAFILIAVQIDIRGLVIMSFIFLAALIFSFLQVMRTTFLKLR